MNKKGVFKLQKHDFFEININPKKGIHVTIVIYELCNEDIKSA